MNGELRVDTEISKMARKKLLRFMGTLIYLVSDVELCRRLLGCSLGGGGIAVMYQLAAFTFYWAVDEGKQKCPFMSKWLIGIFLNNSYNEQ